MEHPVAVIIPARNEEETIEAAVASAWAAGAAEVVVADGGSTDRTVDRARRAGANVLNHSGPRGRQLNQAARATKSPILLFLHADSQLPGAAGRLVVNAVGKGFLFGGFRIRFPERHFKLRVAAFLINIRTTMTKCPWGDQGQFIRREVFDDSGGFREFPLMEDYELALRMKRAGRSILLPEYITTSGRRFLQQGTLRTAMLNWRIILAFRRGADPFELEKLYRGW